MHEPKPPARYYFIDNLRVFIIMVVLMHHATNPYGSRDFWYYKSADPRSEFVGLYLELAPSFTMAVLLIFSGFLLPSSYDRHGCRKYLWEKVIRLGIPLFLGGMVMLPLLQYTYHRNFAYQGYGSFWEYYWNAWLAMGERPPGWNGPGWPDRNLGHLWYIEHLFFYAVCYGVLRRLFGSAARAEREERPPPGHRQILAFALVVWGFTFLVRIWCPLNKVYALFGFLQIDMSHFPLWLPFFFVGMASYRYGWMTTMPRSTGLVWLGVGLAMLLAQFTLPHTPLRPLLWDESVYAGGFHWGTAVKSLWETFFCVGLAIGLIVLFRESMNQTTPLREKLAANAYAVHVFHPPMIVGIQYLLGAIVLATAWKFVLAGLLGIVTCFFVSHVFIRRLPWARRIL